MTSQTLNISEQTGVGHFLRKLRVGPNIIYPLGNLILAIVIIYPGFVELWARWYPAWYKQELSTWERLTQGDSYYTHAIPVIFVSFAMFGYIFRRVGLPVCRTRSSNLIGGASLAAFSMLYLLGIAAEINFITASGMVGWLAAIILTFGGWSLLHVYWQPLALLGFAVPLPMLWLAGINFELKTVAANLAMSLANVLPGIDAVGQGSYVFLDGQSAPTPGGEFLVIESVCSGLRSIINLTWFAALFAVFCQLRALWRVVIVVLALPVAIICNVLRIAVIIAIAGYSSVQTIAADTQLHQLVGLSAFIFALLTMVAFEKVVLYVGDRFNIDWADASVFSQLIDHAKHKSKRFPHRRLFLYFLIFAICTSLVSLSRMNDHHTPRLQPLPVMISAGSQTYLGYDVPAESSDVALGSASVVRKRYVNTQSGVAIDVIMTQDDHGRGVHPPEVCLQGVGHTIESSQQRLVSPGYATPIACQEILSVSSTHERYHLFAYRAGQSWTTSFNVVQFSRIDNKLLGRPATTAMLRVSTAVDATDRQGVIRLVNDFAQMLFLQSLID